jgi:ferric-dicitrate binding protein FerR (iron transport regulator)
MINIPKRVDSQFLIRVIRNEVGEEEKEYFENWLSESDENKEEFGSLILLWEKMGSAVIPNPPNPGQSWNSLFFKIARDESEIQKLSGLNSQVPPSQIKLKNRINRSGFKNHSTWIIRIAAVLLLTIGFGYLYNNYLPSSAGKRTEELQVNQPQSSIKFEKITNKGERITFPLSDGSIVNLNSDSKIIYPKVFASNERKIVLEGEAYFSVQSDINRPFKVVCGDMTVVVTGTEFNVKSRNNSVKVVVAKGSVITFSDRDRKGVQIIKGEMISFNKNGRISKPILANLSHHLAWRQNKLSFSKSPLSSVMSEIERYYNIEVIYVGEVDKSKTLSGIFQTDVTPLEDILSVIGLSLDIKMIHRDNKIFVQKFISNQEN